MSGYVTIPQDVADAALDTICMMRDRAGALDDGGAERKKLAAVAVDLFAAMDAAPVDAGDPAANDTRPDPELLAALCEAVRVQGLTVHATLYSPANPTTTGRHVLEVEPLLPVLAIPAHGSSVTLTSGARGRVMFPPHHEANAVKIKLAVMGRGEE